MKNLSYILLQLLTLCIFLSCNNRSKADLPSLPVAEFRDGDLAFRRGLGMMSRAVLVVDGKGTYSHVGILKNIEGEWCVIHAVPGEPDFKGDVDRVKVESVFRFYAPEQAAHGLVMRVDGLERDSACRAAAVAQVMAERGTLFDHQYDLSDTTEMYCTELVEFAYRKIGIDLSEGRLSTVSVPGMSGTYLLPSDLMDNRKLKTIYYF